MSRTPSMPSEKYFPKFACMSSAAARARLVDVAKTWIGTPFVDKQGVKGYGVDCAYFPIRVANESGLLREHVPDPRSYSPQQMLHFESSEYVDMVLRYAREIDERDVAAGDLVVYRVGRSFMHGAIVVEWPRFVVHPVPGRGVIGSHGLEEGFVLRRERRYFTLF